MFGPDAELPAAPGIRALMWTEIGAHAHVKCVAYHVRPVPCFTFQKVAKATIHDAEKSTATCRSTDPGEVASNASCRLYLELLFSLCILARMCSRFTQHQSLSLTVLLMWQKKNGSFVVGYCWWGKIWLLTKLEQVVDIWCIMSIVLKVLFAPTNVAAGFRTNIHWGYSPKPWSHEFSNYSIFLSEFHLECVNKVVGMCNVLGLLPRYSFSYLIYLLFSVDLYS